MSGIRSGWTWLAAGLVVAASGCKQTDTSYVVLDFKGATEGPIFSIAIDLTLDSRTDSTSFEAPEGGVIELPVSAALEVGGGEGALAVSARAFDKSGAMVAEGTGSGRVTAGQNTTVGVRLVPPIHDAGADALALDDGPLTPGADGPPGPKDPDADIVIGKPDAGTSGADSGSPGIEEVGGQPGATGGAGGSSAPTTTVGAGGATKPGNTDGAGGATVPQTTAGTGGGGGTTTIGAGGTKPDNPLGAGGAGGTSTIGPLVGCKLSITPPTLDFGAVPVGKVSQPQPVTVTNVANGVCPALDPIFVNDGRHFPIFQDRCSGAVLGPSFSCGAAFTFNPDVAGPFQTDGAFTPAQGPKFQFFLTGKGGDGPAPQLTMNPVTVDFDILDVGVANKMEFTVTNSGALDSGAIEVLLNGAPGFSVVNNQCALVNLPKDGRCNFTLMFAPPAIGRWQVTIDAKSSAGAKVSSFATGTGRDYAPLTVTFVGTGKGTVTGKNLNCRTGSPCQISIGRIDPNALPKVELIAQPESPSWFAGWSGPCSGTDICGFMMDGPKNVTAKFNLP
jgi:hypothetical protein